MNFEFSLSRTQPKSWEGCEPPTDDERLAQWLFRYYRAGHHHRESIPNDEETTQ